MARSETTRTTLPAVIPGERARTAFRQAAVAPSAAAVGDPAFEAQLMGQSGVRRGLKGGAPVLSAARGAYLSAEWSGEGDRRPKAGLIKVSEV